MKPTPDARVRRGTAGVAPCLLAFFLSVASAQTPGQDSDSGARQLAGGEQLTLEMSGGGQVWLSTTLSISSYISFQVEPSGVDLSLNLVTPNAAEITVHRTRRSIPTTISLVARSSGVHSLVIRCEEDREVSGFVKVRVSQKRPAAAMDRERVRAERSFSEAEDLRFRYERKTTQQAVGKYEAALDTWTKGGDYAQAARASQELGAVHEQTGAREQALRYYRKALELSRDAEDRSLESEMLSQVGLAQAVLGEHTQGLEQCREALSLARISNSVRGEAMALDCLGEVGYHRGNLTEALGFYRQAELLWRTCGDRRGRAQTLLLLGYSYSDLSEFDRASALYQDALSSWRVLGDKRGQALALVALGRLHYRVGEYQRALNSFNEAMQLVEPMGNPLGQASILAGIAMVYGLMGEDGNAAVYWDRALDLSRVAGVRLAEIDALLSVGETYLASADYSRALERFREALSVSEELRNTRFQASALRFIGLTYQARGEASEALDYYKRSLSILRTGEDRGFEAQTLGDVGTAYEQLGEHDRAHQYLTRAVELSRAARDRLGEATGLYRLARVASARNDLIAARRYIFDSLKIAESLRSKVASRELRSSYLASIHQYHELHIDLLMRLRQVAAALEASEHSRARTLLESLTEAGVDIRRGGDPELLAREQSLKLRLDGKAERLMHLMSADAGNTEASSLEEEVRDLTARYDQLQAEIRSKSPRYAALTQPRPLGLEGIQEQVLDEETLLLEYALGEDRSYLWAVSSRGHTSYELPPRTQIEQSARRVYELLTARLPRPDEPVRDYRRRVKAADSQYWDAAGRLSELLLGPVAESMAGKRLLVVSDGALQYVPFGALPVPAPGDDPVPMIVEHEIVNLPSASALAVLRKQTRGRGENPKSVAVLADPVFERDDPRLRREISSNAQPDPPTPAAGVLRAPIEPREGGLSMPRLLSSRQEAAAIVAVAPEGSSWIGIDFEASRTAAMDPGLGEYQIVHFATHAVVNTENPGLSGIILSMVNEGGEPQNGLLRLHDIYNLELPVELVVLSSCSSALGKDVRGEGLVGIVRGFMYAGANRVIASLWKVDDLATQKLMVRFYGNIFNEGQSPAAALRNAQIEMWRHPDWRSPSHWAAFVIQGEWR